jgi:oxalate---CoA ligase
VHLTRPETSLLLLALEIVRTCVVRKPSLRGPSQERLRRSGLAAYVAQVVAAALKRRAEEGAALTELFTGGKAAAPALVEAEGGGSYTYEELRDATADIAARLARLGIGRGSRVAIVIPDGPDFVLFLLALVSLGAAVAPLNAAYSVGELRHYFEDLKPELLLVPAGEQPAAREAAEGIRIVDVADRTVAADPVGTLESAQPDDIALLLHTSGTTSRPKQVPLSHRNLVASAANIADFYGLSSTDVSYCAMPLFHVHGLVASTFAALMGGGSVVVPRRLVARAVWQQSHSFGVTWFSAGPTLQAMMLERLDSGVPPTTLRFVRTCSSALSADLMAQLESRLNVPVVEAYGMTEASHQMTSNPLPPRERKPGSVGISAGADVRIVNGEVQIRGPGVISGYLENPEANAESFVDGWFRTGDAGELDTEGYLRLTGRLKEMILRGGENISPYEIEGVLMAHSAVSDAVCFAIEDNKYGEIVGAAVQLSDDATEKDLISHCRENLAAFKVPATIHILPAIPRTVTGKVQRRRMSQLLHETT